MFYEHDKSVIKTILTVILPNELRDDKTLLEVIKVIL
jgi:hypothetical protein